MSVCLCREVLFEIEPTEEISKNLIDFAFDEIDDRTNVGDTSDEDIDENGKELLAMLDDMETIKDEIREEIAQRIEKELLSSYKEIIMNKMKFRQ